MTFNSNPHVRVFVMITDLAGAFKLGHRQRKVTRRGVNPLTPFLVPSFFVSPFFVSPFLQRMAST